MDALGFFVNDTWAAGRSTINLGVRFDRYHGWLPEQEQLGATVGPVTVAARTFAESDLYTMSNLWAPRLGYVYDLAGNGKTVVKANYGFYWHNPGVVISQNSNPNIASKSVTYTWNDQAACAGCISGDKRWQPGEQVGNPTAQALEGAIRLNPDIKAPYSHEASVFVERQVTQTMGARVGFVYKTQDDVISNDYQLDRPISAYTTPFTFVDIGVDAVRGTADDRNLDHVRRLDCRSGALPDDAICHQQPRVRALQDGRGFGQQAIRQQVVVLVRVRLYLVSSTIPTGIRTRRISRPPTSARRGDSRRRAATMRRGASVCRRFCGISRASISREPGRSWPLPGRGWRFRAARRTPDKSPSAIPRR